MFRVSIRGGSGGHVWSCDVLVCSPGNWSKYIFEHQSTHYIIKCRSQNMVSEVDPFSKCIGS